MEDSAVIGGMFHALHMLSSDSVTSDAWSEDNRAAFDLAHAVISARTIQEGQSMVERFVAHQGHHKLLFLCSDLLEFLWHFRHARGIEQLWQNAIHKGCLPAVEFLIRRHAIDAKDAFLGCLHRDNVALLDLLLGKLEWQQLSDVDYIDLLCGGCFRALEVLADRQLLTRFQLHMTLSVTCARGALEFVRKLVRLVEVKTFGALTFNQTWADRVPNLHFETPTVEASRRDWEMDLPLWLFQPPIMAALCCGHLDIAEVLRDNGEDLQQSGRVALYEASPPQLRCYNFQSHDDERMLYLVGVGGHINSAIFLREMHIDIHGCGNAMMRGALSTASSVEFVEWMIKDGFVLPYNGFGVGTIVWGLCGRHSIFNKELQMRRAFAMLDIMLRQGESVDARNHLELRRALDAKQLDLLQFLLSRRDHRLELPASLRSRFQEAWLESMLR